MSNTDEPISEHIELPDELSDQDKQDLEQMWGEQEPATYHAILQIWRDVMSPETIEANKGITMQWATVICGTYPQMTYGLMPSFHNQYFSMLEELAQQVRDIIDANEDCLKVADAAEDVAENHPLYKDLLFGWQLALQQHELEWDPSHPEAAATVAALGEIQKFFFSDRGLTAHLDVIKLEFTDVDQTLLREALDAQREAAK